MRDRQFRPTESVAALRIAWGHLRSLRLVAIGTFVITVVTSLMESVSLGLLVPIMEEVQRQDQVPAPDIFSRASAAVLAWLQVPYGFLSLIVLFAALMAVKYALQAWVDYLSKQLSAGLKCILRNRIYASLMRAPRAFYHSRPIGELISTSYSSTDEAGALGEGVVRLVSGALSVAFFIAVQAIISPALTAICLVLTSVSYWFVMPRIRRAFADGDDVKTRMDRMIGLLQETLSGISTVKSFGREDHHQRQIEELNREFLRRALEIQANKIVVGLFMEPYMMALVIIMIVISVTMLQLGVAPLLTFFVIFSRLAPKLKQVNTEHVNLAQNLPHFLKAQELIDLEPAPEPANGFRPAGLESDIEFQRVSFRYPDRQEDALKDVDFVIERRRTTAVVGSSGGGKSTIANILLRHYRPTSGRVRVNGRDLFEMDRWAWLQRVAVVEQEPFLFRGSIAENIRYGKLDSTRGEIEEAARLANADEFIAGLPHGYNTVVGDRGIGLSVGQKQRIALARALVRNPEVLILDEATSALDSLSEQLIRQALERFRNDKTILIIAHRLSTVVKAHQILFIESGRVVESGSHEALLAHGGLYASNYRLQAS
jgi:subfamily B ATP-binding cassette protein MsbA